MENLLNLPNLVMVLLALLLCFFIYKFTEISKENSKLTEQSATDAANLHSAQEALTKSSEYVKVLQDNLNNLNTERTSLVSERDRLDFDNSRLTKELSELKVKYDDAVSSVNSLNAMNASLRSDIDSNRVLNQELQKRFDTSYKELQEQLKVMGHNLVKAGTEDLSKTSKENFTQVVNPLKEELINFKNYIAQTQESNARRSGELQKEIKILEESHSTLSKQAEELAKALRSGGKSQGMWGELQLERVLNASGLRLGIEYEREVAGDRSLGERGRPDAVVRLPDNHCLIIDAKCSLTAYTSFINAQSESDKSTAMKAHIDSLNSHLNELIKKDYSSYESLNSPSFVFMFVPVDAALTDALYADSALYDRAAQNKIFLVSPSTLLPALRVVGNLWVLAEQSDRMRNLASFAQKINAKFNNVIDSCEKITSAEKKLRDSVDELENRLYKGKGNFKSMIDKFDANSSRELKALENNKVIDVDGESKEEDKSEGPSVGFTIDN